MSRSKAHWETDPQCWATATHQRQDGQSCTKTSLQPKIRDDKLRKCLSALRKKPGIGPWAVEGEEEGRLNMWKKKEFFFKALVTISASFLPPEPEGTNNIGKMLLEETWSSLPWKHHADLFQALVPGNSHAAAWSSDIWDMEAHRRLCMASGLALQDQHWAKSQCARPSQSVTYEFKNSKCIFKNYFYRCKLLSLDTSMPTNIYTLSASYF